MKSVNLNPEQAVIADEQNRKHYYNNKRKCADLERALELSDKKIAKLQAEIANLEEGKVLAQQQIDLYMERIAEAERLDSELKSE